MGNRRGGDFFFLRVCSRGLCLLESPKTVICARRSTHARPVCTLAFNVVFFMGVAVSEPSFRSSGAVCVSHAFKKFRIGISEVFELENQVISKRESPLRPIWNFLVSKRVGRLQHRYSRNLAPRQPRPCRTRHGRLECKRICVRRAVSANGRFGGFQQIDAPANMPENKNLGPLRFPIWNLP